LPSAHPRTGCCDLDDCDIALAAGCSRNVELILQQERITLAGGDTAILTRSGDSLFRIALAPSADCYLVLLTSCGNHAG
jgi:hypothetical protein